jgi:glycosyltransferase 2 family protein
MKLPSDLAEAPAPKKNRTRTLVRAGGLLLGIFLVAWFVSQSPLTGIGDQLELINVRFVYLIGVTFVAYLMVTVAWRLSFYTYPGHLSTARLFIIRQIGESLAQINPTNVIAGEALKAVLLKRLKITYKDSIVSLTISRFLVLLSAITLIIIGVYVFFDSFKFKTGAVSLGVTIAAMFLALVFLLYRLGSGKGIMSLPAAVLELFRKRFAHTGKLDDTIAKMREVDEELIDFYRTKKLQFIIAFLLSLASWLMGASEFFVILWLLGLPATFLSCVAIEVGVMVFKAIGAFVPGQIGIEEYASKMMLEFVGVPGPNVWITVSILRRARQLFWIGAGFVAFLVIMKKTGGIEHGNSVHNA